MTTAERPKFSEAEVQRQKQANMERTLAAAHEALANGTLRKRPRPDGIPYTMELRVKAPPASTPALGRDKASST